MGGGSGMDVCHVCLCLRCKYVVTADGLVVRLSSAQLLRKAWPARHDATSILLAMLHLSDKKGCLQTTFFGGSKVARIDGLT